MPTDVNPFGAEEDQALRQLINFTTSALVMVLPRTELPFSVDTDAGDYQVEAALFQTDPDGQRKPLEFWSRSLDCHEKKFSKTENECLV